MAKGQQRSNKELKKQKSTEKKKDLPKYMRSAELAQPFKNIAPRPGQKK